VKPQLNGTRPLREQARERMAATLAGLGLELSDLAI
jgi:hypothetical protein